MVEATIGLRPTLWVKEDLNVITTNEVERRNNKFVMAAARGNWKVSLYLSRPLFI